MRMVAIHGFFIWIDGLFIYTNELFEIVGWPDVFFNKSNESL
jgi:hypothetical protein